MRSAARSWRGAVLAGLLLALPALAGAAAAPPAPSVLVRTEPARRGRLPRLVVAYGTALPAPSGTITLGVQHAGTVARLFVVPGQLVAPGAALAIIAAAPAVVAQYHQALAALALARSERAHMAQLRRQQLATSDQLGRAEKAVTDAESALLALQREGGADPRQILRAPFAAVVTAITTTAGQAVAANAPLVSLARRRALVVRVGLPPGTAGAVKMGQAVALTPLDGGRPLAGRVIGVGGMLDPATHLVDATIAPEAGDPLGGASFRAAITVGQDRGWIVPRDAVLRDTRGAGLFQVAAGRAVRVAVRVVGELGGRTVVDGRLDPRLPVVVSGNYQLAPGMAVRTAAPAHPQHAGAR